MEAKLQEVLTNLQIAATEPPESLIALYRLARVKVLVAEVAPILDIELMSRWFAVSKLRP